MITTGKRAPFFLLCLLAPVAAMAAPEPGVSLGTWSFAGGGPGPGTYAYGGLSLGLSGRLELEALGVAEMTPSPGSDVMAGASLGLSVLGPRDSTYFNMLAELAFLQAVAADGEPGLGPSYLLLRLSPLAIGTPYYGHRDRMFSIGVLYDIGADRFSAVWNVLIVSWYPF